MECFRDIVDNQFYDLGDLKYGIMLNCCAYCKKINSNEKVDNISLELITLPFFMINRNIHCEHQNILMKMMGVTLLNNLKEQFPTSRKQNKDINRLIDINNAVAKGKNPNNYLKDFRKISERAYLELINNLLFQNKNKIALFISTAFTISNIEISGHGFLHNFSYRPKIKNRESLIVIEGNKAKFVDDSIPLENIYLSLGRSLDEGMTEYVTNKMSMSESSRYYIEIQFIKKMINILGEESVLNAYFNPNNNLKFFYDITKNTDCKCDFFDLFYYTDSQEWSKSIEILKRIKGNGNNNI